MPIVTLQNKDGSGVITLDKDDLRLDGLVDEDGEIVTGQHFYITREGAGDYRVRRVELERERDAVELTDK